MNIVEQFGRKPARQEPTLPQPRSASAPSQETQPTANAEKAASALAFMSRINEENEKLRTENSQLRNELLLAHMRCSDLTKDKAEDRAELERYRRYAVTVKTHLQHIVDAATRANDEAIDAGEQPMDEKQAEQIIEQTEREVRVAAEEIGRKFGANTNKNNKPSPPPATNN